jgi:hypothetical protein
MSYSLIQLFAQRSREYFISTGIAVAQSLGIDPTTWRTGDPTKSLYTFMATVLNAAEQRTVEFFKAGFLSTAEGDWKTVNAKEVYGVDRTLATFAVSQVTITNGAGGHFDEEINAIVFKSSLSQKTYHNTQPLVAFGPGNVVTIEVAADEPGTDSNAGADEIDSIVSPAMIGVTVTASTPAAAVDDQSDTSLQEQCDASLGALSPDGPADAYRFVATNAALTGVQDITKAETEDDSGTLTVTIYVAGPAGPVAPSSVTAAQAAIERWATPLTVTPTVVNSVGDVTNYTATISGANMPIDAADLAEAALLALFKDFAIGTASGYDIDPTVFTTAIRNAVPGIVSIPSYSIVAPVHVAAGHVPKPGTLTVTVV